MKPLPFPFPLNIGTDIVHLPRINTLLTRRGDYLTRFTRRILCAQEQRDFNNRFSEFLLKATPQTHPSQPPHVPPVSADMTRWLAGRFAAKEAARKAAPAGAASIGWKDVMVRVQDKTAENTTQPGVSRRPEVVFLGNENEGVPARVGQLSISHDGEYVVATVLAAG